MINIVFQSKKYKFPGDKKHNAVESINSFIFIHDKILGKKPCIMDLISLS